MVMRVVTLRRRLRWAGLRTSASASRLAERPPWLDRVSLEFIEFPFFLERRLLSLLTCIMTGIAFLGGSGKTTVSIILVICLACHIMSPLIRCCFCDHEDCALDLAYV